MPTFSLLAMASHLDVPAEKLKRLGGLLGLNEHGEWDTTGMSRGEAVLLTVNNMLDRMRFEPEDRLTVLGAIRNDALVWAEGACEDALSLQVVDNTYAALSSWEIAMDFKCGIWVETLPAAPVVAMGISLNGIVHRVLPQGSTD